MSVNFVNSISQAPPYSEPNKIQIYLFYLVGRRNDWWILISNFWNYYWWFIIENCMSIAHCLFYKINCQGISKLFFTFFLRRIYSNILTSKLIGIPWSKVLKIFFSNIVDVTYQNTRKLEHWTHEYRINFEKCSIEMQKKKGLFVKFLNFTAFLLPVQSKFSRFLNRVRDFLNRHKAY